jgi:hypothetical protein
MYSEDDGAARRCSSDGRRDACVGAGALHGETTKVASARKRPYHAWIRHHEGVEAATTHKGE